MIRKIVLWVLTLSCAAGICFLSSQSEEQSNELSDAVVKVASEAVTRNSDEQSSSGGSQKEDNPLKSKIYGFVRYSSKLRDTAHIVIFALLSLFVTLLVRAYNVKLWFVLSPIIGVIYSVADETLQELLSRGRSFQLDDIFRDILGCIVGLVIAAAFSGVYGYIKKQKTKVSEGA